MAIAGRRRGKWWTVFCLSIVYLLCGLWHGAGVTFLVWGIYQGALMVFEYVVHARFGWRPSGVLGTLWMLLMMIIGFVFVRSANLDDAVQYLQAMFLRGPAASDLDSVMRGLTPDIRFYIVLALFFAFAPLERMSRLQFDRPAVMASQLGLSCVSLIYSSLLLAANSFNPFIYFRF